ncbi:MAG: hypothetical protein J7K34_05745 [Flavobacteriaceae bacterium]|nr:hypothetical protein [Flavobacteriaceae bacterium]
MFLKKVILLGLIVVFVSCTKTISKKNNVTSRDSLIGNTNEINFQITKLNSKAITLVETWNEYQNIDELLKQYQNINANLALLNAKELAVLAKQLKDSIRVERLKISSVKIRLNVLHNETLRLADMSTIPSITEDEVVEENSNILNAYSALNLKINNIVNQEKLNEELSSFIEEVLNLNDTIKEMDSTKISLPKKRINHH